MPSSIVLASSSPHRRRLLNQLRLQFDSASPDIDETPRPAETATELVQRLSIEKAEAVAQTQSSDTLVIGSDQCAEVAGHLLGKPLDRAGAIAQLSQCSGQRVHFFTGVCVRTQQSRQYAETETRVTFRHLNASQICRYLDLEQPFDCAGSFKCEGLGIALFETIESCDPSALVGLPLLALNRLLQQQGVDVLSE